MKVLLEMIKSVNLYHYPNSLQVLGKFKPTPNRTTKLYEGIKSGKFTTDEDAAMAVLNCSPKDQVYKNLKGDLRNRVINTLFFIDPKKFKINSKHNQIAIHCDKRWVAAKILLRIGAKNAGIQIAQKVLQEAQKAGIVHMIADIALYLRFHYGTVIGDQKKFEYYNNLFHKYEQIQVWENKAQEYYIKLALSYTKSKAEKSAIHEKAKEFYNKLKEHIEKYKTYNLIYYGGLVKLITHMSINDYQKSLDVCDETLTLLNSNPLFPSLVKATFMLQQLICCIQLKQFEKGEELIEKSMEFLKPGYYNWFKHQELFFLLSTHTRNYQRAYEVLKQTLNTKGFSNLDNNSKEVWKIYELYTKYLISQDKIIVEGGKPKKIYIGKLMNELPSYSQDKRGLNIAILIIQILFYVQRKQYDKAISRIDAIEKYCSRYLKKDNEFRSNCFIKMILQLPVARFHPAAALRKADNYYEKLKGCSIDVAKQAHSIEIIPYEDLWEIAIASLYKR